MVLCSKYIFIYDYFKGFSMKKVEFLRSVELTGVPFVSHIEQINQKSNFDLLTMFEGGYHGALCDVMQNGFIKLMGYQYSVSHLLKHYIIKTDYGIFEYYAPNKTLLRKNTEGFIYYIIEAPKQ